jgi:hypothetical protein
MTTEKTETVNEQVYGTGHLDAKVTELVGRAIDAPVENNPERSPCGKGAKRQGGQQSLWE